MDGQDILAYRTRHNLTQKQLARLLGLSDTQMINRWERGKFGISGAARTLMLLLIAEDNQPGQPVTEQLIDLATENFRETMRKGLTPI